MFAVDIAMRDHPLQEARPRARGFASLEEVTLGRIVGGTLAILLALVVAKGVGLR